MSQGLFNVPALRNEPVKSYAPGSPERSELKKALEEAWSDYNLYSFVGQLWPDSVPTSQPYVYKAKSGATITELPNNGSLADYVTGEDILEAFKSNANFFCLSCARHLSDICERFAQTNFFVILFLPQSKHNHFRGQL